MDEGYQEVNEVAALTIQTQMAEEESADHVLTNKEELPLNNVDIMRKDIVTLQANMNNQFARFEEKLKESLDGFERSYVM